MNSGSARSTFLGSGNRCFDPRLSTFFVQENEMLINKSISGRYDLFEVVPRRMREISSIVIFFVT